MLYSIAFVLCPLSSFDCIKTNRWLFPMIFSCYTVETCDVSVDCVTLLGTKNASAKRSFVFLRKELPVRWANIMKEIRLLPEQLLSRPSVKQVSSLWVDVINNIIVLRFRCISKYTFIIGGALELCILLLLHLFCICCYRMERSFLDVLEYENSDPDEPRVLNKYVCFHVIIKYSVILYWILCSFRCYEIYWLIHHTLTDWCY